MNGGKRGLSFYPKEGDERILNTRTRAMMDRHRHFTKAGHTLMGLSVRTASTSHRSPKEIRS